jgi:hypothetical protein
LAPKFYGPYHIIKHIGLVAYKLALRATSKIHPVFHVSCLKKVVGQNCRVQTILPELDEEGSLWLQLEVVLNAHECSVAWKNYQGSVDQVEGHITEDVTWEPTDHTPAFSASSSLRTRPLLKGEGMLGSDPNPSSWVIS